MVEQARTPARACIVGAGLMGRWHAASVSAAGGIVAAIVDHDAEAARKLAARHSDALVVSTLDEALSVAPIDVVHVCTPLPTHAAFARLALERGAHVLIEKPLAAVAAETESLVDLAGRLGRLIVPVHQLAFQRGVLRAHERLPDIGRLQRLSFSICSAGGERLNASRPDEIVDEILPHPISVALAFGLAPKEGSISVLAPRDGELTAIWCTDGGATVSIAISMNGRPPHNSARLVASQGTLHFDFFHGYSFAEPSWTARWRKAAAPFERAGRGAAAAAGNLFLRAARREPAYPGLRELVSRFYAAVATGGSSPIPAALVVLTAKTHERLVRLAAEAREHR